MGGGGSGDGQRGRGDPVFPDGQLWADLGGLGAGQALTRFLRALGVPHTEIPPAPDERADLYRSLMDGRRMLVVLDSAGGADQVRPLLPGAPGCLVLVTSRGKLSGLVAAEGAYPVVLGPLSHRESRQLLKGRLGAGRLYADPRAADDIIRHCAGIPLALAVVAARAATHAESDLADLAAQLRGARAAFSIPGP